MDYIREEREPATRSNQEGVVVEAGFILKKFYLTEDGEEESDDAYVPDPVATAALPANQTPEMKRRAAYVAEADPIRVQADGYDTEAVVLRETGDTEKADAAEAKAHALRLEYMAKKEEIRARLPDPRYSLTSSGTYHTLDCSYGANGAALTLAEIATTNPAAKPCSRCGPPALG